MDHDYELPEDRTCSECVYFKRKGKVKHDFVFKTECAYGAVSREVRHDADACRFFEPEEEEVEAESLKCLDEW